MAVSAKTLDLGYLMEVDGHEVTLTAHPLLDPGLPSRSHVCHGNM